MPLPPRISDDTAALPQDVAGWFVRRDSDSWTSVDEQDFLRWLDASPDHRGAYARWEADWQSLDALSPEASARLRAQVALDRAASPVAPAPADRPARADRRRLAAMLSVAGLGLAGGGLLWRRQLAEPTFVQALQTARGQQRELRLPDGSVLRLDAASQLQVRMFRDRREVRLLAGQAYFAVQPDADRPFNVLAGDARVTVVGTRFSVRHTPDVPGRGGVEVAVDEGRVRVAPWGSDIASAGWAAVELQAGQQAVLVDGVAPAVVALSGTGAAPWRSSGQISFSNAALDTVVAEMERYAALELAPLEPAVAGLRLSGTFDPRDAAGTRRLLAQALPLSVEPSGRGYALRMRR